MMAGKIIHVHADWAGLGGPVHMGLLHCDEVRGKEVYTFAYDREWLARPGMLPLDPQLQLFSGPQYPAADKAAFGLFMDSAPDRWGRMLMQRREARQASVEGRPVRKLAASDFLLGVSDRSRPGALRFSNAEHGPFLAKAHGGDIPPMAKLRALEHAAWVLEHAGIGGAVPQEVFALLMAPGSSLGGARPKASVVDPSGQLWIAKFPSGNDPVDKGAWELVVNRLAARCGIVVPPAMARKFGNHGHTFLISRFDRDKEGMRTHYASAMTLLGRADGDDAGEGASYLELAELLMRQGTAVREGLEQLWKRIAFSICVSNTDDHLRNHGFLLEPKGWRLSPAFDLNPEPEGAGLALNIDAYSNALSLGVAVDAAPFFRVPKARAGEQAREMAAAVERNWRKLAAAHGLGRHAVEQMEPAFRHKP